MAGTTDTVKAKLTPGEFVIRKEAVDMIGVPMLNKLNDMPEEGGHSAIDNIINMATLSNMKMMYGGGMVKPNYAGGGMVQQYGHGGKVDKMMGYKHGGKVNQGLKPVPKSNPGLGKLPEMVRNRMGYMQEGGEVIDYLDTAGLYNRFLLEGGKDAIPQRELLLYQALQSPSTNRESYLDLYDSFRKNNTNRNFMKDASITSALLNQSGMEGISESDSLKLVKSLSPEGKRLYDALYSENGMQHGGMVQDSLMGMMGGGMVNKKNKMMGYQDGGTVGPPVPPEMMGRAMNQRLSDSIDMRQANPEMYQGSSVGSVRQQAKNLQQSIMQDTAMKAKKSLDLIKLMNILREGGEGVPLDSVLNSPMPVNNMADSTRMRDLEQFLKMQQMQRAPQ
tara:strand:+ start:122 stop:1294 length:1173 start_codon:yes stop_codon:yes gene_type:complete